MSDNIHPDLVRWLDAATRGLPREAAQASRAELLAHYQDACDDYVEQGLTTDVAHGRALADLGVASTTASGLVGVHRGQAHYLPAALASMVFVFAYFVLPPILQSLGGISEPVWDVLELAQMGIMVYVLAVLRWLVRWRFAGDGIETAFRLIIGGVIGEMIAGSLSLILLGTDAHLNVTQTLFTVTGFLPVLTLAIVEVSWLVVGVGTIYLGLKVMPTSGVLYGLEKPVAFLSIMMGLCMIAVTTLAYVEATKAVLLVFVGIWLVHATIWPLFTLLFFRAAYRSPVRPARLA